MVFYFKKEYVSTRKHENLCCTAIEINHSELDKFQKKCLKEINLSSIFFLNFPCRDLKGEPFRYLGTDLFYLTILNT